MGTSASGGGAGNGNPLIPSWISSGGGFNPQNNDAGENNNGNNKDSNKGSDQDGQAPNNTPQVNPNVSRENNVSAPPTSNRYTAPKRQLNKFVSSGGSNGRALRSALRGYSRNAAGSTGGLARRMAPSVTRVAGFAQAVDSIRTNGLNNTLRRLNLGEYVGKPIVDILSALTDVIFSEEGSAFHDIQDDSLTKQAYSNAIVRICEDGNIDLDALSGVDVEIMTATFIEETIVQRIFTDIGSDITKRQSNVETLIEIENTAYQIVSGLVRTQIMPQIQAGRLGNKDNLNRSIENAYRIAFDVLSSNQE